MYKSFSLALSIFVSFSTVADQIKVKDREVITERLKGKDPESLYLVNALSKLKQFEVLSKPLKGTSGADLKKVDSARLNKIETSIRLPSDFVTKFNGEEKLFKVQNCDVTAKYCDYTVVGQNGGAVYGFLDSILESKITEVAWGKKIGDQLKYPCFGVPHKPYKDNLAFQLYENGIYFLPNGTINGNFIYGKWSSVDDFFKKYNLSCDPKILTFEDAKKIPLEKTKGRTKNLCFKAGKGKPYRKFDSFELDGDKIIMYKPDYETGLLDSGKWQSVEEFMFRKSIYQNCLPASADPMKEGAFAPK